MKKFLLIAPIVLLTACDRPSEQPAEVQMTCVNWGVTAKVYNENEIILDIKRNNMDFDTESPQGWLENESYNIVVTKSIVHEFDDSSYMEFVWQDDETGHKVYFTGSYRPELSGIQVLGIGHSDGQRFPCRGLVNDEQVLIPYKK